MMGLATLTFSSPQWVLPVAVGLVVVAVGLAWSYRRAPVSPGWRWTCFTLKLTGIAALAACLLEPLWVSSRARDGANLFAVVVDNSQGLQVKDRGATLSRGETLRAQVSPAESGWQTDLARAFDVRRYLFDARLHGTADFRELDFSGRASGLAGALRAVQQRFQGRPLAGILVFTDGNATDVRGTPPAWEGLPPVYPVVVGRTQPVRDLSLQQVNVSQAAFEDAPVAVQADVAVSGFRGDRVAARLVDTEGKTVTESSQTGGADGDVQPFRFRLKPETNGLTFYRLEVKAETGGAAEAAPDEEATQANNQRVLAVDRGKGPFRILYVSGRPNWEFKFLNRALSEDHQLDLVALIRVAKREPKFDFLGRGGETSNPLYRGFGNQAAEEVQRYDEPVLVRLNTKDELELRQGFPRAAEYLYGYHAVILDDLEAGFFSADQAQVLQTFVSERGGGFLMLGGMESFREGGYHRTPVGDMLPVYLDRGDESVAETGPVPVQFQLAREGWLQAWARLHETEDRERARIEAMPLIRVLNRVRGVKPGASTIATGRDEAGHEVPALVVQRFGRGRTAALLAGDFWRWGTRDAERQEQLGKAWRQLARWLVADVPERVQIESQPVAEDTQGTVALTVRVRDARFKPVETAAVTVEVEPVLFAGDAPAGVAPIRLRAEPVAGEAGAYAVPYVPRRNGGYRARAVVVNEAGAELGRAETGWSTDLAADEFRSLVPNVALLEDLARKTGGEVVAASALDAFVRRLPERRAPVMELKAEPLWHTPTMFALALACLAAEWGLRRRKGLP
ncbi:MAG: glutamine amidotransferase [Opitutaceae bacterium]